jgi:DNA-directed RNA polymerase subunit RPC12/RpoP
MTIYAAYVCDSCEVEGRHAEISGEVVCWNCGCNVRVTARVTILVKGMPGTIILLGLSDVFFFWFVGESFF